MFTEGLRLCQKVEVVRQEKLDNKRRKGVDGWKKIKEWRISDHLLCHLCPTYGRVSGNVDWTGVSGNRMTNGLCFRIRV